MLEVIVRLSYIYYFYIGTLPTFTWGPEFDKHTYSLQVDFHDGGEPAVAGLTRIASKFGDDDKAVEEDECTLRGYLGVEDAIPITVSGCPGNDTFQVKSELLEHSYSVLKFYLSSF